mmetsp:Transcript_2558/g.5817  ORF Transcript_2558/g.5817 Transcript_2558/m.5817 type:complete len:254 (-) Transcript_2558:98-859(-)
MVEVVVVLQLHGSDELEDLFLGRPAELVHAAALPDRHEHRGQGLLVLPLQLEYIHAAPPVDRHRLYALCDLQLPVVAALLLPPVPDDDLLRLHPAGDHLEALYPLAGSHVHVQPCLGLATLPGLPLPQPLRGLQLPLHPLEHLLAPLDLPRPLLRLLRVLQEGAVLRHRHGGARLQRGNQVHQTVAGAVQVAPVPSGPCNRVGGNPVHGRRVSHHHLGHSSLRAVHDAVEAVARRLEVHELLNHPLVVSRPLT